MMSGSRKIRDAKDFFTSVAYIGNNTIRNLTTTFDPTETGAMALFQCYNDGANTPVHDTVRGNNIRLLTSSVGSEYTPNANQGDVTFTSTGLTLGTDTGAFAVNYNNLAQNALVFKKAPRFFDIVTWTGDGSSSRTISHNLGVVPGLILIKRRSASQAWCVYSDALGPNYFGAISSAAFANSPGARWPAAATTTSFSVNNHADVNASSSTYVAYLFAHDTASDSIIKCGTYTGTGNSNGAEVNLGFRPQFLMIKCLTTTGAWLTISTKRFMGSGPDIWKSIVSNTGTTTADDFVVLTPTGFKINLNQGDANLNTQTYQYVAVKVEEPTDVQRKIEEVFSSYAHNGYNAAHDLKSGVDLTSGGMVWAKGGSNNHEVIDSVNGDSYLVFNTTAASVGTCGVSSLNSDGVSLRANSGTGSFNGAAFDNVFMFKKKAKFFDVVSYTGNGASNRSIPHGLGIQPGLVMIKCTSAAAAWTVTFKDSALDSGAPKFFTGFGSSAGAGSSTIFPSVADANNVYIGSGANVNTNGNSYICYVWADDSASDGIIRCGTYTGNGSTVGPIVNVGWEPQFVMVKAELVVNNWVVYDKSLVLANRSVRNPAGITPSYTALNLSSSTTALLLDLVSNGFQPRVNNTHLNTNATKYLYMAIRDSGR